MNNYGDDNHRDRQLIKEIQTERNKGKEKEDILYYKKKCKGAIMIRK